MIRLFTTLFPLILSGLVASPAAFASPDSLSPAALQQALASDVSKICADLPSLRSAALPAILNQLYQSNGHNALWKDTQRRKILQAELGKLVDDGLTPGDYAFALKAVVPVHYCDELRISSDYLLALEHLSLGRLAQQEHEPYWQPDELPPASVPSLSELAFTGIREGIGAAFEQARPALPQYLALRAAYALMDRQAITLPTLPPGPLLRPGMSDERLELMAALLHQKGFMPDSPAAYVSVSNYNQALVDGVRAFQARHGLEPDGVVGPRTISELNRTPAQREQQVRINLERMRWINAQRSEYLLLVNVASGHIQLMRGNNTLWQARVQVGRPSRPTPLLVSYINRITLNPSWTVPPTILRSDILPQIRRDPDYLAMRGIQTLDAQGRHLDPRHIDWNHPGGVILRQPPGPTNPLGQMVFRLPNPFSIYLHDTPSKHLFRQANRSLSSGCVRVENAHGLAAHLVAGMSLLEIERIEQQLASGQTHEVALRNGPRLILAYWTASVDEDGQLAFLADNYEMDQSLMTALTTMQTKQPGFVFPIAVPNEAGCASIARSAVSPESRQSRIAGITHF